MKSFRFHRDGHLLRCTLQDVLYIFQQAAFLKVHGVYLDCHPVLYQYREVNRHVWHVSDSIPTRMPSWPQNWLLLLSVATGSERLRRRTSLFPPFGCIPVCCVSF